MSPQWLSRIIALRRVLYRYRRVGLQEGHGVRDLVDPDSPGDDVIGVKIVNAGNLGSGESSIASLLIARRPPRAMGLLAFAPHF
jgi:hypothetical protein